PNKMAFEFLVNQPPILDAFSSKVLNTSAVSLSASVILILSTNSVLSSSGLGCLYPLLLYVAIRYFVFNIAKIGFLLIIKSLNTEYFLKFAYFNPSKLYK